MEHVVIATFTARAGRIDEGRKLLADLRSSSLGESGLLAYDCYERLDEPGTFVVVERYVDEGAFRAHTRSEHFRASMPALLEAVDAPTSHSLQPLD